MTVGRFLASATRLRALPPQQCGVQTCVMCGEHFDPTACEHDLSGVQRAYLRHLCPAPTERDSLCGECRWDARDWGEGI